MSTLSESLSVAFFEVFEEEAKGLKQRLPSSIDASFTFKSIGESELNEAPAPIVCTRTQSVIPPEWANPLKAVLSRSTGYDHLLRFRDAAGAQARDVHLGYLPEYCADAVAEQAILLLLALSRKLPMQLRQMRAFERDGLTGRELSSMTLAIFGVGNIGSRIARRGRALGMNVLGVDLDPRHAEVEYVEREAALARADAIVCAMNLTPENIGYFDLDRFELARRRPIFINIARGEMSPTADLLGALETGLVSGAALDVYDNEHDLAATLRRGDALEKSPHAPFARLLERDDVILTPHNAFNTREALVNKCAQTVEQIEHFRQHGAWKWAVPDSAIR